MNKRLETPSNIWITGASSGIGESLTRALTRGKHKLVITGRRSDPLEALKAHAPKQISPAVADTISKDSLQSIAPTLESHGNLNMAILNAGTCEYLEIHDYSSDVIEKNIQTNVMGTARCVEIALPALRRTRFRGLPATLVIIGSSASWFPFARAEGYGASKAALSYFARSLRADLAGEGIDVVLVSPGFVKTPLTEHNDFPMPFLVSADNAAERIVSGLAKGHNEIAFPKRFTWILKSLSILPQSLLDRMAASLAGKRSQEQETGE